MTNAAATSRTVTMAFVAQGLARRGAAASAEGLAGFIAINEAKVRELQRERIRVERRRLSLVRGGILRQAVTAVAA
jgi:hypothetical protein